MQNVIVSLLLFLWLCAAAEATLIDRGNGMIYDDVLNITWLQDASFGGDRTWDDAVAWADTLVFEGFDDWRQPLLDLNFDDTIIDCSVATELACRDNELGYMFYHNLEGMIGADLTGDQGLIENIQIAHWSGTNTFSPDFDAVYFFDGGGVVVGPSGLFAAAWAVRPGDVLAVPEPATLAMLGLGIAAWGLARKRKKRPAGFRSRWTIFPYTS